MLSDDNNTFIPPIFELPIWIAKPLNPTRRKKQINDEFKKPSLGFSTLILSVLTCLIS